jgi:hypothetical protein
LRAHAEFLRDVEGFKNGVDTDAVARLDELGESDGNAVQEDQIDLRVRHVKTFDEIFGCGGRNKRLFQSAISPVLRQVVVKFGVEAD